jgi:hypothetical protein
MINAGGLAFAAIKVPTGGAKEGMLLLLGWTTLRLSFEERWCYAPYSFCCVGLR